MPTIRTNFVTEEDVPTAAELNATHDSLATVSADMDSDNASPGWITRKHFDTGSQCNQVFTFKDTATTQFTTTSTSYIPVDNTTPSVCNLDYQPQTNEVLRVSASGMVGDILCTQNYSHSEPTTTAGNHNYYAFELLLSYSDSGGPTLTQSLGEWGYSFTTSSRDRYERASTPLVQSSSVALAWQTFQFSTFIRYDGDPNIRTYESITLRCKVYNAGNVLAVERNNILAVRVMR